MLKRFQKLLFAQKFLVAFALCALGVGVCACPVSSAWADTDILLGAFFNSDDDLSDTLYASFDGVTFNRITTPFQCDPTSGSGQVIGIPETTIYALHDPGLFYKDGYFWMVGGYTQNQPDYGGWRMTPMFACSKDLFHWSFPGSGSDSNLAPETLPLGTQEDGRYDSAGSEAFADDDGTVWFVTSLGYFGMHNGDDYNDTMMPYICKIDSLEPGEDPEVNAYARPKVSYGDIVPINLPMLGDNWIDPSIYKENGKYYLSIKKDGVTTMIFSIDDLNNAGDTSAWTLVCGNVITGYEGPSLTNMNGEYMMYTDKLKEYPPDNYDGLAGNWVTRSYSLSHGWHGTTEIKTQGIDSNGYTYSIPNRHGSVLKVPDETRQLVLDALETAGWDPYYDYKNIYGTTSADTSAKIATRAFPEGSETVVLARDDDFADAMSATGLAGSLNAPILLTNRESLSYKTGEAIKTLGAKEVYIIGGTGAISSALEGQLKEAGCKVTKRVYGTNSWDTSVECANLITQLGGNEQSEAIVAMSTNFQDALSISSYAYKYHVPILLETAESSDESQNRVLTSEAKKYISSTTGTIYVPGGPAAVPETSVEGEFKNRTIQRIYGEDGYDTSNQIATYMTTHKTSDGSETLLSANTVCITNGAPAPKGTDALAGSALAGVNGGVILLTNGRPDYGDAENYVTIDVADSKGQAGFLKANAANVANTYVLGGPAVMPEDTCRRIEKYVIITR